MADLETSSEERLAISERLGALDRLLSQDEVERERLSLEIAELARQDQLVSREEDLTTFKLTGAFAPVSFPDILTIEPGR